MLFSGTDRWPEAQLHALLRDKGGDFGGWTGCDAAGLTTLEYEDGVVADLRRVLDELAPPQRAYQHHLRRGDDNGSAHVLAALIGPSLVVPFADARLAPGSRSSSSTSILPLGRGGWWYRSWGNQKAHEHP